MNRGTTVLLVRHAESDGIAVRLAGRLPGITLTGPGRAQAERLPDRLRRLAPVLDALYVSPQRRAFETAVPIGRAYGISLRRNEAFAEIDFGDWTGLSFDQLEREPSWRDYNAARASAPVPRGEAAPDLQRRVETALAALVRTHHAGTIAVVTHAEIIRTIVLRCLGRSLDEWPTVAIEPASITGLRCSRDRRHLLFVNAVETTAPSVAAGREVRKSSST